MRYLKKIELICTLMSMRNFNQVTLSINTSLTLISINRTKHDLLVVSQVSAIDNPLFTNPAPSSIFLHGRYRVVSSAK